MKKRGMIALPLITALMLSACTSSPDMRGNYQGDDENIGDNGNNGNDDNNDNNGSDDKDGNIDIDLSNVVLPKEEIMILYEDANNAWFPVEDGFFVYTDGTVFGYDFNKQDYGSYDCDEYIGSDRRYELIRKYVGPHTVYEKKNGRIYQAGIDEDLLKQFYALGKAIDSKAGFKQQQAGNDMGQLTLYFVDGGRHVQISSYGDMNYIPKDNNAVKFEELWDESNLVRPEVIGSVHVYDGNDFPLCNPEWGYDPDHEGSYIFTDPEALEEFSDDTDWDLKEIFDVMGEYNEPDEFIYLVRIENVNSGGYDLKSAGVLFYEDHIDLIPSENNVVPDGMVVEMMDGFCSVCALPKYMFNNGTIQFYHFDGTPWTMIH